VQEIQVRLPDMAGRDLLNRLRIAEEIPRSARNDGNI